MLLLPGFVSGQVEISGAGAGAGANGLVIQADNCVIKGLIINKFDGSGIVVNGDKNDILGNIIGTDRSSSVQGGNGNDGISIKGSNNIVGGQNPHDINIIAGNRGNGISITGNNSSGNQIIANYIGTDTLGTDNLGNGKAGIEIVNAGANNQIGTGQEKSAFLKSATGAASIFNVGNVIAKSINAIKIENTSETQIAGNIVGLFKSPNSEVYKPLGSLFEGIKILNSKSTVISNLILGASGSDGIRITGPESKFNKIFDAFIGSDPNGTEGLGCMGSGICIDSMASENKLGGCDSLLTIVSNANYALEVINSKLNKINGVSAGIIKNIGTRSGSIEKSAAGLNLGNLLGGMKFLDAANNTIGDSCAKNIIAANLGPGMIFDGSQTNFNKIIANLIGTDDLGSEDLGNEGDGMTFINGANENIIGGEKPGDANISVSNEGNGFSFLNTFANKMNGNLSGVFGQVDGILKKLGNQNSGVLIKDSKETVIHLGFFGGNLNGIRISGESAIGNKITGVFAGTDGFASLNLGNSKFGILIDDLANNNILGGAGKDSSVVLGGNKEAGLYLQEAKRNKIYNTLSGIMQKLNATQMSIIKNLGDGVVMENSEENQFGSPEMPNMVGANSGSGLMIKGLNSIANKISASYFGTDSMGHSGLGNIFDGILITDGASQNIVGGEDVGEGIISVDNGRSGIAITGLSTTGNSILNSISGAFQRTGMQTQPLGNNYGMLIENSKETIFQNSTFAANKKEGGLITGIGAEFNKILNCRFGTDSLLSLNLGNLHGLLIQNGAQFNTIGGILHNYFSGNTEWGLIIKNADNNQVINNIIGGLNNFDNSLENIVGGIKIENSSNNTIGRSSGGLFGLMENIGNLIQGHDSAGVAIINSPGTQIVGNEILQNNIGVMIQMQEQLNNILNRMNIMNNKIIHNLRAFEGTNTEVYVAGNQISENTGLATGIHLFNSTGKIKGNLITGDAGDGIALENGSNPLITKNNIFGNTGFGVRNFDSSSMVDATQNWWGNANGPSGSGSGLGDKVSDAVDFSNWKTSMIEFAAFAEDDTVFVLAGSTDTVDVFLAGFQSEPGKIGVDFADDMNWITGQSQLSVEFTNEISGAVLPLFVNVPAGLETNSTNRIIVSSDAQTGSEFSVSDTFYLSVYQPQLISLNISPDTAYVNIGTTWQFSAIGLDQENNSYVFDAQWDASGGTIDNTGLFTAGASAGTFYAVVTDPESQLSDTAIIRVLQSTDADIVFLQDFKLSQNYPNPFSGTTTIKYNIPFESRVSVRIFTINGVIVQEFLGSQPSGEHLLEWDATGYSAGMYFYSIDVKEINGSHSFRDVRKMSVLLKEY